MWRIYGVKIDPETGEIIKDRTLIFRCITPEAYEQRGKNNAESHGYTITEIWKIGTFINGWKNVRIK